MSEKSSTMGIASLRALLSGNSDLQRHYNWEVILPDIAGYNGIKIGTFAQECFFGQYEMSDVAELRVGKLIDHFAGLFRVQTVRIKFLKPSPDILTDYFTAWEKLIVGDDGLYNVKSVYQKNIYVRFLETDGSVVNSYKCVGAFPTTFPWYQLDYSNKYATMIITFSVDKLEYSDSTT
jgi:hypothetical protein